MNLTIRPARAADLGHIAPIEDSGAAMFAEFFGEAVEPVLLAPAVHGAERDSAPGFLLVGAVEGRPAPVGFVHVLDIDGHAHLEQLSVRAEYQHRGIGRALVEAALAEARRLGYPRMTLCTYRDVPWNGPFYRRLGFVEVSDPSPLERRLIAKERELRLDVNGARSVMAVTWT